MKKGPSDDTIEFMCPEEQYDVISKPIPSSQVLPDWYKHLQPKMGPGLATSTVKMCMPFKDAMTAGWIIPLAADVEFISTGEGDKVNWDWNFSKDLVQKHNPDQLRNHEHYEKPIIKFLNYWAIKVPDGYSVLFIPPMNRVEERFKPFSGMVDCDDYFNFINFPAVWMKEDYHGIVPSGTPLVQVIPIKRETLIKDGNTRPMTDKEKSERIKKSDRVSAHQSEYIRESWSRKPKTTVKEDE